MIEAYRLIRHNDPSVFGKTLSEQINDLQSKGYQVEVQYSTTTIGGEIFDSALVLAREENDNGNKYDTLPWLDSRI